MTGSQGLLKALRDLVRGRAPSPEGRPGGGDNDDVTLVQGVPERFGPYRVRRKLGQGGMGVVYEAHDERLERSLAIKVIARDATDENTIRRFWREARAAAAVNHPNVCQLYELGEHEGALYIAMELLEGEPLAERLRRGALPLAEAMPIAFGMLAALQALHARALVHRDLKPSNVFLTPHGVKLLDFGLARKAVPVDSLTGSLGSGAEELTRPGMILGTPRYMAPEQVRGEEVDARADLFAVGAILFEMLAGRPPFTGKSAVEVFYATLHEQPPALTGSPAVAATDRVIRKALQKRAEDRPPSAEALLTELKAIALDSREAQAETRARTLTRLVVLPFRMLRPDPDIDFLSLGLADAVSTSLSNRRSVVVRSSASAARFTAEQPDLRRIAAEADVDLVLLGTLLRSGDKLRATAHLVEAPSGTVLGAHTVEASVGDVFRLQDEVSARIVESLALRLDGRVDEPATTSGRRAPVSPRAYELYLRGNHAASEYEQMPVARDLYLQAVEDDPLFAPAWARLGRAHRLIGKYIEDPEGNRDRAEAAFRRALELEPDLSIAHKLYSHFEAEWGGAPRAMVRLLERARYQREDAELFAGLVHACRYCGLFEASVAAYEEARRLDPHVPTSLSYTLYLMGDYERLHRSGESIIDHEPRALGLVAQGRREEALHLLAELARAPLPRVIRLVGESMQIFVEGRVLEEGKVEEGRRAHTDPEALYMFATFLAGLGRGGRALAVLRDAVGRGYAVAPALLRDPLLAAARAEAGFAELVAAAEAARQQAQAAFERAGGPELLGI